MVHLPSRTSSFIKPQFSAFLPFLYSYTYAINLLYPFKLLPLLILLGSFAIYFKKYNISEERYDEICAEIAKRKLAAEGNAEVVLDGADVNELENDLASSDAETPDEIFEQEAAADKISEAPDEVEK